MPNSPRPQASLNTTIKVDLTSDELPQDESECPSLLNPFDLKPQIQVISQSNSRQNLLNLKDNISNTIQGWQKDIDVAFKNFNSFIATEAQKKFNK